VLCRDVMGCFACMRPDKLTSVRLVEVSLRLICIRWGNMSIRCTVDSVVGLYLPELMCHKVHNNRVNDHRVEQSDTTRLVNETFSHISSLYVFLLLHSPTRIRY
jgi:hypothetical protein